MIYTPCEPSDPIRQGDIFFGIPRAEVSLKEITLLLPDSPQPVAGPWESVAGKGLSVIASVPIRPVIGMVGTQECDAVRADDITLFEVRPFLQLYAGAKDAQKPLAWVKVITQQARTNLKWFYLPVDPAIGFEERMGVDFLASLRVSREDLEGFRSHRPGRLNDVAEEHFREHLSEFFRRYAYDEWYPLNREEMAAYQASKGPVEPFSWQ